MLNYRDIRLSEFKQLWLEQCPQIILMKPATDPCSTCQGFTVSLSKFARGGKGTHVGTILKRQRSREIITGISVKKAKKILQTYHRIKE